MIGQKKTFKDIMREDIPLIKEKKKKLQTERTSGIPGGDTNLYIRYVLVSLLDSKKFGSLGTSANISSGIKTFARV